MGVWIETSYARACQSAYKSHPSWVCGLKPGGIICTAVAAWSHPSWVCGLKLYSRFVLYLISRSHPSWVCGLKLNSSLICVRNNIVTPFVGVWIETSFTFPKRNEFGVTPFVGVWIETNAKVRLFSDITSHPSWVCGLKLIVSIHLFHVMLRHTLRGCVDWNLSLPRRMASSRQVTPFVGVWIETRIQSITSMTRTSHPSWVCGLKRDGKLPEKPKKMSHPSWVCGLKRR